MNPEFIIRIIVRARNEIAGVLDKAAADVNKLTKAQDANTAAGRKHAEQNERIAKSYAQLSKDYDSFVDDIKKGKRSTDEAVFGLEGFRREFEKLSRAQRPGSQLAFDLRQAAEAAKTATRVIEAEAARRQAIIHREMEDGKRVSAEMDEDHARRIANQLEREERAAAERKRLAQEVLDFVHDRDEEQARNRKILADEEVKETARVEAARSTLRQERGKLDSAEEDAALRRQKRLRDEQTELRRTMGAYQEFRKMVERGEVTGERARLGLEQHASRLRRGAGRATPGSEMALDLAQASTNARALAREVDKVVDTGNRNRGFFARMFNITPERFDAINEKLREFEQQSNRSGFSAVRLAGNLRGMVIVGVIAFFQQLIGVGVSVAGVLVSVASAAVQAGASLAGMAVAAVAQAVPALGLLAAAWGRVGAVFDALKAQQKARLQATYNDTQAADKQKTAADSMRSAQEGLADSQRAAKVAQENLTKARRDAVGQIEDLVAAEKSAELQAEAARLALDNSNRALRASIGSGDVSSLAENSLQVRQDINNVGTTGRQSFRARRDARAAVAGGIEGMPAVVAARRAVDDANRSIARAREGLQSAGDTAAKSTDTIAAADRNLAMLLGDLSPAEKRLFDVLSRVRDRYRKLFTGKGGILEPITNAFTEGGRRALDMLRDPSLISAARRLSGELGGQISRINDLLSSPAARHFYAEMADEASRNLPTFTSILIGIGKLLAHIAQAAGPALHTFLKFLDDMMSRADDATGEGSGMSKLADFFMRGEKYAESIFKLTGAVGGLFVALTGAASEEGNNAIDQLTSKIQEATQWINDHQQDVAKFFRDARQAFGFIAGAVWALAKALVSLFKPDQVETFASAFKNTFIPALKDALEVLGLVSHLFSEIAASSVGGMIFRFATSMLLLRKALGPVFTIGGKLLALFGYMTGSMRTIGIATKVAEARFHPLFLIITALVALFLALRDRIHNVGDALKILVPVIGGLVLLMGRGGLVSMVAAFATGLERIAAVAAAGKLGLLGTIFGGLATRFSGLLRMLPGVGKLLAGEAAVAEGTTIAGATTATAAGRVTYGATTAATTAEGAAVSGAEGAAAGGVLKTGAMGLLKKAGWIGVGISAAQGIISGFQHGSVKAGVQDFLHSITFGLVKSADEIASEAAQKLNDKLEKLGKGSTGKKLLADTGDKLFASSDLNKDLKTAAQVIVDMRSRFNAFVRQGVNRDVFSNFLANLKNFAATAPPEFKGVLEQMVSDAEKQMARLDRTFKRKVDLASFVATFSRDLGRELNKKKPDINKVIDTIPDRVKELPPAMRKQAAAMAANVALGMAEKRHLPREAVDGIRKDTVSVLAKMRKQADAQTARMAADQISIMQGLGIAFGSSLRTDFAEPVNDVLSQLGIDKRIKIKRVSPKSGSLSGSLSKFMNALPGSLDASGDVSPSTTFTGPGVSGSIGPRAAGGFVDWVGRAGERGKDLVHAILGRGELVLNHWQQRAVNSLLPGQNTLSSIVSRMRGVHAGSFATGGFVNNVGAHIDTAGERGIAAGLAKLGRFLGVTFAPAGPRSARRTSAENAQVGGSATSNHLRGLAMDVAPDIIKTVSNAILNRFGLNRPMSGGWLSPDGSVHDERNHIELLRAVAGSSVGALSTIANARTVRRLVDHLRAPQVSGDGAMSWIIQGLFGRLTGVANRFMDKQADRIGSFGGKSLGVGGDAAANLALGKKMAAQGYHWIGRQWQALRQLWMGESGWRKNANNPSSGAYGIPQSLPGSKMASAGKDWMTSAGTQIKWGLKYIKDRYGSPATALASWLSRSPHWYEKGGEVRGSGPIPAVLHGDEHVWTAREVARVGGHSAMRLLRRMLGGGGQGTDGTYASGGRVLDIGDSLSATPQFQAALKKALGGSVTSIAKGGKSSLWGLDQLSANFKKAFKTVVWDLGTNDGTTALFERSLKKAYRKVHAAGSDLIVSTLSGTKGNIHRQERNDFIREFARTHSGVTVAAINKLVRSGQIKTSDEYGHVYGEEAKKRARAIADAVKTGGGGTGAGGGENAKRFNVPVQGFTEIRKEINRLQSVSAFFKTKVINAKFTDRFSKTLRNIVGDGGLLDRLKDASSAFSDTLARNLNTATFKLSRAGNVIEKLGPVVQADRTYDNFRKIYRHLIAEQREITDQLDYTNNRLAHGKLTKAERAELVATRRNLEGRVKDVVDRINDNLKSTYEAISSRISTRVDRASSRASSQLGRLDIGQRMREMVGGTFISAIGGQTNQQAGEDRAGVLNRQADAYQKIADFARRRGHGNEADALVDQIKDLRLQALEAVQAGIKSDADEIVRKAGRASTWLDLRQRVVAALGRVNDVGPIIEDRLKLARKEITDLSAKRAEAIKHGFYDLAEQLGDQIDDLNVSIVELTAQKLQDLIDLINNAAQRQSAGLDLRDRLADLRGRAGDAVGAAQAHGSVLQSRGSMLMSQRGALSNILMAEMLKPASEQNTGAIQSLTDQIADLDVSIAENTQAISDNTVGIRQASIDAITHRGGFLGGIYSGLGNLVTALDAITGGASTGQQSDLLSRAGTTLRQTGSGLRDQLFGGYGVDVRGLDGMGLVNALKSLNYDGIEANFSEAQKSQFEDLINSVIENATAVETNTDQLNKLNNNNLQSFSSTAWKWWRQAIFTGSGGLLPQYNIPHMSTGGQILSDGVIYGHAGEEIVAANVKHGIGGTGGNGDINVNVTSPTEVLDPGYVGEVIHFKRSRARAS